MHSFCLNFIADFSSICSLLLVLSGPIEISLLLHTPNIPENEMNRMHYIPLGRDVEQRDLPSFFLQMISNQGKESLSAVKLLIIRVFLVSAHCVRDTETVTEMQ